MASQRDIEAASASRVSQMLALIPDVELGSGSEGPAIRGQDATGRSQALPAFLGGNRPRPTLIVDGRRDTYNEFVFGIAPVWGSQPDRGIPQPADHHTGPELDRRGDIRHQQRSLIEPEYRARVIGGNYRTGQVSALRLGPLSGDVAVRVSGDLRYSRTTSRITDRIAHGDPNHEVFALARAKAAGDAERRSRIALRADFHTQSQAPQLIGLTSRSGKARRERLLRECSASTSMRSTATAHQPLTADLVADMVVTVAPAIRGGWLSLVSAKAMYAAAIGRPKRFSTGRRTDRCARSGVSRTHLKLRQFMMSALSGLGRFNDARIRRGVFWERHHHLAEATLTSGCAIGAGPAEPRGVFDAGATSVPLDYDRTFHVALPKVSFAYDVSRAVRVGLLARRAYDPADDAALRHRQARQFLGGTAMGL